MCPLVDWKCAHREVRFAADVGLGERVNCLGSDAKVTQLHLATPVDQNVRRLHVCREKHAA